VIEIGTTLIRIKNYFHHGLPLVFKEIASVNGDINEKWLIAMILSHKLYLNLQVISNSKLKMLRIFI